MKIIKTAAYKTAVAQNPSAPLAADETNVAAEADQSQEERLNGLRKKWPANAKAIDTDPALAS